MHWLQIKQSDVWHIRINAKERDVPNGLEAATSFVSNMEDSQIVTYVYHQKRKKRIRFAFLLQKNMILISIAFASRKVATMY